MTGPTEEGAARRVGLDLLVPLLVYAALFSVLWRPDPATFTTHFWSVGGDGYQNAWNLWWVRRALLVEGTNPWFTSFLHHPDGVTLLGATLNPFNGLLAVPLGTFLGLEATYNAVFVFSYLVGGLTAYWLARHLTGCRIGSLFAGAAFTFSTFHMAHGLGHLQLIALEWIPLFLLLWLRLLDAPSVGRAALAALGLGLVALCDYYYLLYCVVAGAVLLLWRAARDRGALLGRARTWGALATFAVLSLATSGVLALSLLRADAEDPFVGAHDPYVEVADAAAPLVPGGTWLFARFTEGFWGSLPAAPIEGDVFLGWTVLAVAGFGLVAVRAQGRGVWALLGLVFFVLSLGPRLHVFGQPYEDVWTPYRGLLEAVPFFRLGGMPVRMSVMVALCAAVLAAWGLVPFLRGVLRGRWWLLVLFTGVFVVERLPVELPVANEPSPPWVLALAVLPDGAVDVPVAHTHELLYQTRFEKPMSSGYVARLPRSRAARLERLKGMRAEGRYRELLESEGLRYALLEKHPGFFPPQDLKPVHDGPTHGLWVLPEDPLPALAREPLFGGPVAVEVVAGGEGGARVVTLEAPDLAGRPFRCLFSLSDGPGVRITARRVISLAPDVLFWSSVDAASPFFEGHHGSFDERGRARVVIRPPEGVDLSGTRVLYSLHLVDPDAPFTVGPLPAQGALTL